MYLDDEGYTVNEEQEALAKKAKAAGRIGGNAKSDKERKKVERVRKPNEEKVEIVSKLAEYLMSVEMFDNVEIAKAEREVNFKVGENSYTVALTLHRPPKK